ncbi:hypothetical protein NDU88_005750 [Pleurodeles waltl]|uniref:Uncharacterized protein n=1 Tax=Pleurodeles waltl TaxID=8319 RepID=A0AAV7MDU6_PLEWA|nr:hypothetical protein NDU88_005750 [Pleurodeles waltl]
MGVKLRHSVCERQAASTLPHTTHSPVGTAKGCSYFRSFLRRCGIGSVSAYLLDVYSISRGAIRSLMEYKRSMRSARFRLAQLFLSEAHSASQRDRVTRQGAAGIPPARRESLDLGSSLASAPNSTAAPPAPQLGGDVFTSAAGQIAFFAGF